MKLAIVSPLLKKEDLDKQDLKNYRPVSNLSFLSKLLEKAVSSQVTAYLETNEMLPSHQSAYRAHHSTKTFLVRIYSDLVAAADIVNISLLTLLNLSAAIDTVDYAILLSRLSLDFGFSPTIIG